MGFLQFLKCVHSLFVFISGVTLCLLFGTDFLHQLSVYLWVWRNSRRCGVTDDAAHVMEQPRGGQHDRWVLELVYVVEEKLGVDITTTNLEEM